jgi:hypothetical protein
VALWRAFWRVIHDVTSYFFHVSFLLMLLNDDDDDDVVVVRDALQTLDATRPILVATSRSMRPRRQTGAFDGAQEWGIRTIGMGHRKDKQNLPHRGCE